MSATPATAPEVLAARVDLQQIDLYRFFALVFASPTPDCFRLLSQDAMPATLGDLWQQLGCGEKYPGFEWFGTFDLYESAYIALFDVGVPEPPVPLFESAHDKSHPAQEIALENTFFYELLGLRSDPTRAVPDFLITQLEFLAALRYTEENAADPQTAAAMRRAEHDFINRHMLNWLPAALAKLAKTNAPGFPTLMSLLLAFLHHRLSE